jgi:hypothetical protein
MALAAAALTAAATAADALPNRFVYRAPVTAVSTAGSGGGLTITGNAAGADLTIRGSRRSVTVGDRSWRWPVPPQAGSELQLVRHGATASILLDGHFVAELVLPPAAAAVNLHADGRGVQLGNGRLQRSSPIAFGDDFMRASGALGQWQPVAGTWALDRIPNPGWSANAFRLRADGSGLCVAGHWFWHDIGARVAVQPGPACRGAGIVVGADAAGARGLLLRWQRTAEADAADVAAGELQLVALHDGAETVLARHGGRLDTSQWLQLTLLVHGRQAIVTWRDLPSAASACGQQTVCGCATTM